MGSTVNMESFGLKSDKYDRLFIENKDKLEELAYEAIVDSKLDQNQFIVVCIDVDDPPWTPLANYLMPDQDWDQFRESGEAPLVLGSVKSKISDYIGHLVPEIAEELKKKLPTGVVRAVVLCDGGAFIYQIQPISSMEHNRNRN